MEIESLKQLEYLKQAGVMKTLITDRYVHVSSFMTDEKPEIDHTHDVWHLAKGFLAQLV